jgi:hypothetical protein
MGPTEKIEKSDIFPEPPGAGFPVTVIFFVD